MTLSPRFPGKYFTLVIVFAGVLFSVVLFYEYKTQITLQEKNRQLLRESVALEFHDALRRVREQYPQSFDEIDRQPPAGARLFYWFSGGRQVYPSLFLGSGGPNTKPQWLSLIEAFNGQSNAAGVNEVDVQRIAILGHFTQVIANTGDPLELQSVLADFLENKLLYRSNALAEVASLITLVQLDEHRRLPEALVRSLLLTGWETKTGRVLPALEWLLEHNQQMHPADYRAGFKALLLLCEKWNFNAEWAAMAFQRSLKPFALLDSIPLNDLSSTAWWVVQKSWLYCSVSASEGIVIPFDGSALTSQLKDQWVYRGVLSEASLIQARVDGPIQNVGDIQFTVKDLAYRAELRRQRGFFAVKMALLMCLVLLSVWGLRVLLAQMRSAQKDIELKESFVRMVGHELKTPLASIRLMAETLSLRLDRALSPKQYTQKIVSESHKLEDLVESLLSYQRFKNGSVRCDLHSVNLREFVLGLVADMTGYGPRPLSCVVVIAAEVELQLDPTLMALLLKNLLLNAMKYCEHSCAEVSLTYDAAANRCVFQDNGIGIPRTRWRSVFKEFYRLPRDSAVAGSGIGLALCWQVAHAHGARFYINASSAEGTRWHLDFPKSSHRQSP